MAQTYTLEEAADKLDLSIEEFKRRLRTEWTQVRAFRDGTTLRFRANEIDELARSIGLGSSDELPMADSSLELPVGVASSPTAPTEEAPLKLDDSDEMFLITPDEPGKSGSSGKLKAKSDSDVRLEKASKRPAAPGEDEESILTEEFETPGQGGSGKLSGKSGKLSAAKLKSGDSGKHKSGDSGSKKQSDSDKRKAAAAATADDSSSEFELSLEPDSDEFELSLAPDSSEEVALGAAQSEPAGKSGQSGINLNRPSDSGVSLEKRKKADEEEIDFELSLEAPGSGASGKKAGSGRKLEADSDSEFELTLEEPSDAGIQAAAAGEKKGDIFEATDFEIPALEDDSASEAVSLDEADTDLESSDFDLALDEADAAADDESASEVVALEEGDVKSAKAKRRKKKVVDEDEDDDERSVSDALADVDEDEEYEVREAAEEPAAVVAVPTKWGAIPAVFMFPTAVLMFLGALMAYETLHSVWGYQQANKPTTPLITFFADTFDLKPSQ
jgi:hypothetical protein